MLVKELRTVPTWRIPTLPSPWGVTSVVRWGNVPAHAWQLAQPPPWALHLTSASTSCCIELNVYKPPSPTVQNVLNSVPWLLSKEWQPSPRLVYKNLESNMYTHFWGEWAQVLRGVYNPKEVKELSTGHIPYPFLNLQIPAQFLGHQNSWGSLCKCRYLVLPIEFLIRLTFVSTSQVMLLLVTGTPLWEPLL